MPRGKGKKWKKNGYDPQQDDDGYGNFHVDEPNLRGYEYDTTGASSYDEIYGAGYNDNSYSKYNSASGYGAYSGGYGGGSSSGYGAYSGGYGGGGNSNYSNSTGYNSGSGGGVYSSSSGYGGGGNSNYSNSTGYNSGSSSGYKSSNYANAGYGSGGGYSISSNSYNPNTYAGYSSADYDYEESDGTSRYYDTDKTADEVYGIMGENPNTGYVQKPLGKSRLSAKSRGKYGSNYGGKSRKQKKTFKKNKKLRKTRRRV
jgi:hypothetical protein